MPQPLFDHLSNIESRLRASRGVLLFLDFDGTLTPIVEIPYQAVLHPATRLLLERLSQNAPRSVIIVSGRALGDIRERVGLANLTYAGNHGLEICGDGLHFVEPIAVQRIKMLASYRAGFANAYAIFPAWKSKTKSLLPACIFVRPSEAARTKSEKPSRRS